MIENDRFGYALVPPDGGIPAEVVTGQTTGRFVVVLAEGSAPEAVLREAGVANVADSRDFTEGMPQAPGVGGPEGIILRNLNIAVISADRAQVAAMQTSERQQGAVLSVSPELIHHVMDPLPPGYLTAAYRAVVADLGQQLQLADGLAAAPAAAPPRIYQDTKDYTWGVHAVQAISSPYSGKGVKVAVLDTGFDLQHPDFAGRAVTAQSFVVGQASQDGHGHGTHCIGTACGPRTPSTDRRYGVAYEADIFVGKVLSDQGSGSDGGILAGIEWAITHQCEVISMSLGSDWPKEHPPYTVAGRRALDKGSLIIAAAGNNAKRLSRDFGHVGPPANSPSIMAVGALNQQLDTAFFSARSTSFNGGQVDVAGPGFQVYSSWPMPQRYHTISGTSMAAPHAAGVAALVAQKTGYRGRQLWSEIVQESQRLLEPSVDVGSGLVIAPQQ